MLSNCESNLFAVDIGSLFSQNAESPFDLETNDFINPTEQMFSVLEKLVPDFGKELPEVARAESAQVTMMKKEKRARHMAEKFEKAKFILESQREYGEIIFNATNAVSAIPQALGLQYTGAGLSILELVCDEADSQIPELESWY